MNMIEKEGNGYKVWDDADHATHALFKNRAEWNAYRRGGSKPRAKMRYDLDRDQYKIIYSDGYAIVDTDGTLVKAVQYDGQYEGWRELE